MIPQCQIGSFYEGCVDLGAYLRRSYNCVNSLRVSEQNLSFNLNNLTALSYLMDCGVLEFWIYYTPRLLRTAHFPCFGLFLQMAKVLQQRRFIMG